MKLDDEVIQKLGTLLAEKADEIKELKKEQSSLRIEIEKKDNELNVKQRELDALKRNTRMMIEELENQNQALRNELMKMKNALLNPAQQQKKEDREAMEDSDDDEAEMETENFAKDDSGYQSNEGSHGNYVFHIRIHNTCSGVEGPSTGTCVPVMDPLTQIRYVRALGTQD